MLRALVALLLLMGTAAARDTDMRDKPQLREPSKDEQFWRSPKGQHMRDLQRRIDAGEIGFDDAFWEYRKRWYEGKPPDWSAITTDQ